MPGADAAERVRRYTIEVLAPKQRPTQVLRSAPVATDVVSAHSCVAVYKEGTSADGFVRFAVDRYLKYAHLFPELASGLVKEFVLPLASADAQTALLADDAAASLTAVVGGLRDGDRVELDWLQIRIEMDTAVDAHRFGLVEQCQKLAKLDEATEKALCDQFPQPQIMIKKPDATCKPEPVEKAKAKAKKGKKGRGRK